MTGEPFSMLMSRFVVRKAVDLPPRLPLRGSLDLTYRCANDCRHCWLRLPPDAREAKEEMSFEEIARLVEEARAMGCREWTVSGGEPLLRPDFPEILDLLNRRAAWYTLNTNGTLITPPVARLLRHKGTKLVALYGATAEVHDAVTRIPGSFEALRRGIACLREAGAGFTVQIVPLRTNIHQYEDMIRLAESWSPSWRLGATWLYLSASGDPARDRDIAAERLDPAKVAELDLLPLPGGPWLEAGRDEGPVCANAPAGGGLYAACLAGRRDFHIDPYGKMSFCSFVKDPALRFDLRRMSFAEAWDERLPALASAVRPTAAYGHGCGSCDLRADCKWCPVFAYLETRDHSAKVDYLCRIAHETRRLKADRAGSHSRRFRVAGLALAVESDLPFREETLEPELELFRDASDGPADIHLRLHFALPDIAGRDFGEPTLRRPPWTIYRKGSAWIYVGDAGAADGPPFRVMVLNNEHTRGEIYSPSAEAFERGGLGSLALLPSDQIILARALPFFGGAFVHAAGVVIRGQGLVFAGPSESGKSTVVKMIGGRGEVLCDDRVVVRREEGGFRVHGTWSHGEVRSVSPASAPLRAVLFLRQADGNRIEPLSDPRAILRDFLPRLVRPLVSSDWWALALELAEELVGRVPFYDLHFDRSGAAVDLLEGILG